MNNVEIHFLEKWSWKMPSGLNPLEHVISMISSLKLSIRVPIINPILQSASQRSTSLEEITILSLFFTLF